MLTEFELYLSFWQIDLDKYEALSVDMLNLISLVIVNSRKNYQSISDLIDS